ncbi:3-isopropylmalate dehydratase large subunit [Paraburkholderia caledonica]|uniref:3-isopropylmalate dehydratase n=1 Tax=Paraburkholderia caledonica TaxID=134536 RepID=A0ABU1L0S3_9BURK|nr:3-isopropylmalate dehydratase large subunit [Paraburkholderia caledonica]MDR6376826.1 3-isopropylmalate/(R)-2-methylmalate dehydratase large subunit [Paraburkholderia caledonica]
MAQTLFDRIWDAHVVTDLGGGWALLAIDRHLLHDLSGPGGFETLAARGLPVSRPDLSFATADHAVSSAPHRTGETNPAGAKLYASLRRYCDSASVPFYDLAKAGQGIVHVMAPEMGLTLPGTTIVCGDSHTCTHGGLGALAFGIGSSELAHVLATQTVRQKKPRQMRITYTGALGKGVFAKDLALHVIAKLGCSAGVGYAIEHSGSALKRLSVEERLTLCNMSVELGSKIAFCPPDDVTFDFLRGLPYAPAGDEFEHAVSEWRKLRSDDDAHFDVEVSIDLSDVEPMVTWGTTPEHALAVTSAVPDPTDSTDAERRKAVEAALEYMGLSGGQSLAGTSVDWVFIGSCANSRISDLREAASIVRGKHVAPNVQAWVVPGSQRVKEIAEAEGLADVFRSAGFEWREPGCSMCVAANGDVVPPGQRIVSTSNRNFIGRQGPGARTHLASPATAAAAAIAGAIVDPRRG